MAEPTTAVLVLRDDTGTPYILPREVVEHQELVALRVANEHYLVPRDTLLGGLVPESHTASAAALVAAQGNAVRLSSSDAAAKLGQDHGSKNGPIDLILFEGSDHRYFALPRKTLERGRATSAEEQGAAAELLGEDEVTGYMFQAPGPLDFSVERLGRQMISGGRGTSFLFVS